MRILWCCAMHHTVAVELVDGDVRKILTRHTQCANTCCVHVHSYNYIIKLDLSPLPFKFILTWMDTIPYMIHDTMHVIPYTHAVVMLYTSIINCTGIVVWLYCTYLIIYACNMSGKVPSEPQLNGVLQISGCDSVLDTVRNSRYDLKSLVHRIYD